MKKVHRHFFSKKLLNTFSRYKLCLEFIRISKMTVGLLCMANRYYCVLNPELRCDQMGRDGLEMFIVDYS